jgi:hypothetical protein
MKGTPFLYHRIQVGSGDHPTSLQRVPGALVPGVKWPRCEAGHSPLSIAEVKNAWS